MTPDIPQKSDRTASLPASTAGTFPPSTRFVHLTLVALFLYAASPFAAEAQPAKSSRLDTPATLADPEALRQSIPALREQRHWTEFATPAQIKLYQGPETVYPDIPPSAHDLTGFDPTLLGSAVPAPGVHPRILFSPGDIPLIKRRLEQSKTGQKALIETRFLLEQTLYNPASDEGKIYAKLMAGDTADLKFLTPEPPKEVSSITLVIPPRHWFVGYKQALPDTLHTAYLPNLLAASAFQALLDGDTKRGRQTATAIANYYRLRNPFIDAYATEQHQRQLAPRDYWRAIFGVAGGNNLAFCYDLAAPWMNEEQRDILRHAVASATSGRLAYGMNGPARWAETNWTGWDLEHYLTALAIEGEKGYDPDIQPAALRTLKGYLQWGISPQGTIFESNGKIGAGFHYAMLTAIALARRGENQFGHPHLRQLPLAQAQRVVPSGEYNVNNGTWGNANFAYGHFFTAFYPGGKIAAAGNFLMRQDRPGLANFNPGDYQQSLEAALSKSAGKNAANINWRKLTPLTPAHTMGPTPYDCADWSGAGDLAKARASIQLPLDFADPVHGLLVTRSGPGTDALFLMFEVRANLSTIGHQHHDAGHFYLASDGEMWAVEAGAKSGFSYDHSNVRIGGRGLADVAYPPRVKFLGSLLAESGAVASADISAAYNHGWVGPTQFQWTIPDAKDWKITPETDPEVVAFFRGTQNYKMRIWGDHYFKQNWGPTMRVASANPVKSACRTAALVRGPRPYVLILDDVDKGDGRDHDFDWVMQVPNSVRLADIEFPAGNPASAVLVKAEGGDQWRLTEVQKSPNGTPALLVVLLDVPVTAAPQLWNFSRATEQPIRLDVRSYTADKATQIITRTRLYVSRRGTALNSRIALIPFRIGEPLPKISWDATKATTTIQWPNQTDTLAFSTTDPAGRTRFTVQRGGSQILASD
ncbi:MAG: hypothetical protein SFU85_00310 [Candidatus Methylacidiphilales bacterium]|nr:hypothetical protein [Candidatus Methylacidiphilales bacterium]